MKQVYTLLNVVRERFCGTRIHGDWFGPRVDETSGRQLSGLT